MLGLASEGGVVVAGSLLSNKRNLFISGDNQSTLRRKRRRKDQPPKLQTLFTVTDKNIDQISKGEWLEDTSTSMQEHPP